VQRADITVDNLSIDPRKAEYLLKEHQVGIEDVFDVYNNAPAYFVFDPEWETYDMIGPTLSGRFMVVGIRRIEGNEWRVVTAYWNDDGRAQKEYEGQR
jgi:hypothetical protein